MLIMQQHRVPPLPTYLTRIPLARSVFEDINQAKDALLQYTVAKGLSYQLEPTDKRRLIVECLRVMIQNRERRSRFRRG
jgi:hypothetical protein